MRDDTVPEASREVFVGGAAGAFAASAFRRSVVEPSRWLVNGAKNMSRALVTVGRFVRGEGVVASLADHMVYAGKVGVSKVLSDHLYSQMYYWAHFRRLWNVRCPSTFNEKIQWLKLFYRPEWLPDLVDKYAVRAFVAERIGEEILIPLYGVFDSVNDIAYGELPDAYVLKPSHGSGWVIVCTPNKPCEKERVKRKLRTWMSRNYYYHAREWPYKDVKARIICEQFLGGTSGRVPDDYKIFCFGGTPRYVQVDIGRFSQHRRNFYDMSWNRVNVELRYPGAPFDVERPARFDDMREIAAELSRGIPFCRVDLYAVEEKVYFGEITFYPENGIGDFWPENYDAEFGRLLMIPRL